MTPLEQIIELAEAGISTHAAAVEHTKGFEGRKHMELLLAYKKVKNLADKLLDEDGDAYLKVIKWDALESKIAKCYVDDDGEELSEEETENIDLGTIGEIAANAFGWL